MNIGPFCVTFIFFYIILLQEFFSALTLDSLFTLRLYIYETQYYFCVDPVPLMKLSFAMSACDVAAFAIL